MEKSELLKDFLDKEYEQYLEEYRNFLYLLIGLIVAFVTSQVSNLNPIIQSIFFLPSFLVLYLIVSIRKKLERVRKDVLRLNVLAKRRLLV